MSQPPAIEPQELYILRGMTLEDRNFVFQTWIRGVRKAAHLRLVPSEDFKRTASQVIRTILQSSKVAVLCDLEDPSLVIGYVIYSEDRARFLIHGIYVKGLFRGLGIARHAVNQLAQQRQVIVTEFGPLQVKLLPKTVFYNPYAKTQNT